MIDEVSEFIGIVIGSIDGRFDFVRVVAGSNWILVMEEVFKREADGLSDGFRGTASEALDEDGIVLGNGKGKAIPFIIMSWALSCPRVRVLACVLEKGKDVLEHGGYSEGCIR